MHSTEARVKTLIATFAAFLWLPAACAPSSTISPNRLPDVAPEIRSIRLARYGSPCSFTIDDPATISRVSEHFKALRPGTANKYRSFEMTIQPSNGASTNFVLGDNWVALAQTGHTHQTSAWRFRDGSLFALLGELMDSRCG